MIGALEGFAVIGLLIGVGYALASVGVLDESAQRTLSRLVYFAATPALLIDILADADVGVVFGPWFAIAILSVASTLVVSLAWWGWRKADRGTYVIACLASSYANAGFLGLPIAAYVLGDARIALPTMMLQLLLMAPIGLSFLDLDRTGRRVSPATLVKAALTNPVTVGAAVGTIVGLSSVELPRVLAEPVSLLGSMAIPAALMAFGVSLKFGPRLGQASGSSVAVIVVLKLIWQPVVAWLLAVYVFDLPNAEVAAVTMMAALPTANNVFIYASRFARAELLARDSVAITTVLSVPVLVGLAAFLV